MKKMITMDVNEFIKLLESNPQEYFHIPLRAGGIRCNISLDRHSNRVTSRFGSSVFAPCNDHTSNAGFPIAKKLRSIFPTVEIADFIGEIYSDSILDPRRTRHEFLCGNPKNHNFQFHLYDIKSLRVWNEFDVSISKNCYRERLMNIWNIMGNKTPDPSNPIQVFTSKAISRAKMYPSVELQKMYNPYREPIWKKSMVLMPDENKYGIPIKLIRLQEKKCHVVDVMPEGTIDNHDRGMFVVDINGIPEEVRASCGIKKKREIMKYGKEYEGVLMKIICMREYGDLEDRFRVAKGRVV